MDERGWSIGEALAGIDRMMQAAMPERVRPTPGPWRTSREDMESYALDPNHALPVAVGADCRTTHYACQCVMEQLEKAEAEVERLRAQAAAFRSLLEAWRDEFYFENFEGKYRECKVCGADDTRDHDEGCIVQRTLTTLASDVCPASFRPTRTGRVMSERSGGSDA